MDLLRLEQQRQALDANLNQLRQSLKHWQTWEAEYEGLKEELLQHEGALSSDTFAAISDSYGGDLVNASEIRDLTGLSTGTSRSVKQVVGLIERRQEYVQRNIETVQRQFFDAEAKQEELAFATSTHGAIDDDGDDGEAAEQQRNLPLTEIHEELDEEGNVISTRLSRPEEDTANVVDSLRKAGLSQDDLKDIRPTTETASRAEELKPAITNATPVLSLNPTNKISPDKRATSDSAVATSTNTTTTFTTTSSSDRDEPERPSIRKKSVSFTADTKEPTEQPRPESEEGRKSVSFAEKVAVMPAAPPPDMRSVSFSPKVEEIPAAPQAVAAASPEMTASSSSPRDTDQIETETWATRTVPIQADPARQKELREAYKPGEKVIQLNDDDEIESVQVVLPENESAEDAATRREMLEYHLNEVGHVVAQMDLDDSVFGKYGDEDEDDAESYHTTSEYLDDGDTPYTSGLSDYDDDDDEDEDEHGRSTRRMISPEYRKQMLELQDRLIGNMGPDPKDEELKDVDPELDPADVHRLVIREKRASVSSTASEESGEKKSSSASASASSTSASAASSTTSSKKRVSFAESVDIAEPATAATTATATAVPPLKAQKHQEGENVAPVSEKVAERSTAVSHSIAVPTSAAAAAAAALGRKSRFLQSRAVPAASHGTATHTSSELPANSHQTASNDMDYDYDYDNPTGPPGRTLADKLTERIPTQRHITAPSPSADENDNSNDEVADRRQLASEYYRRRNNFIQEQGGFGPSTDEDEMLGGQLMEERADGKVRRVSRFKAARIRPM